MTVHSTKTAMPIAKPRMVIGKISDSSSQTSVPMKVCTKNTTMQHRGQDQVAAERRLRQQERQRQDQVPAATPVKPVSSSGRRLK